MTASQYWACSFHSTPLLLMFHIIWHILIVSSLQLDFQISRLRIFLYHFVTGEFSSLTIIIITDIIDFVPLITFVLLICHTFLCLFFLNWFFINYILMMICRVCKIVNTIICKKTLYHCKDVNLPDCSLFPFFFVLVQRLHVPFLFF